MGFRLNLKWGGLSVQSPFSASSSSWPSSYSCRGKESSSYFIARSSVASVIYGETDTLADTSKPHAYSTSPHMSENYNLGIGEIKMALGKRSGDDLYSLLDGSLLSDEEDSLGYLTSLQAKQASQFQLLLKNLNLLEGMFVNSDVVRLENNILKQLERLGALRLFHSCLSRTLKSSTSCYLSDAPTTITEEPTVNDSVDNRADEVVITSGKKELRKLRRKRSLENERVVSTSELLPESISTYPQQPKFPSGRRTSRSKNKRQKIAKNEAEMASGVKLVAELEKIRTILEKETGQVPSLSNWAEAAGIEEKKLQQDLHYGWRCRDELLRSTRSLILFIARNYWGYGVAFEDLIQAGKMGVLQGAERFDQSRGYKFSTYVQYWIRKSISTLVAKHARGVKIPSTLSKAITQVQKARKALSTSHGKCPDDCEIAKFTGLSLAKITSASKCLRVVGSIDQTIGEFTSTKFLEVTPDSSIPSPEEFVMRQHMVTDIYTLLNSLEPREKQVLILRFGLRNRHRKSLEEIGRLLSVSKEWIRKIERSALTKLKSEDSLKILSHYVYIQ